MGRLLLVDDDSDFSFALSMLVSGAGWETTVARSRVDACTLASREHFDAATVDLQLPDGDGFRLMADLAQVAPRLPAICLTARDEAASAVRALKLGAVDYLTKPVSRASLLGALSAAAERKLPTVSSPSAAQARSTGESAATTAIGESKAWTKAMQLIRAVARAPLTTVLLSGPPGTGKEVAAQEIVRLGARSQRPFVTTSAAALTASLIDSELFGHEAGAFTGAVKPRRGLFELAHGGTLFLDEIGELPTDLQAKLLRILETRTFRRLGGEREITTDARVICATNRDLARGVREGWFRADLYERLRVFEIPLPPLSERKDDIPRLAAHFLRRLTAVLDSPARTFSPEVLEAFARYSWPGNVRELRNVIERALILAEGEALSVEDLPREVARAGLPESAATRAPNAVEPTPSGAATTPTGASPTPATDSLDDAIRAHLLRVVRSYSGNLSQTAHALGISRSALRKKLRSYGLEPSKLREASRGGRRAGSDRASASGSARTEPAVPEASSSD